MRIRPASSLVFPLATLLVALTTPSHAAFAPSDIAQIAQAAPAAPTAQAVPAEPSPSAAPSQPARPARPVEKATPVRQVVAFVPPYYEAALSFGEIPKVKVSPEYDALFASTKPADVRKARDMIAANPDMVSPLAMSVLAIRLYDVGLRDDAVFWFFAARGRYAILQSVLDVSSLTLVGVRNGMQDFADNAGPTLYGYAFCDLAREQAAEDKALQWTIAHPYKQLFTPQLPARSDDRNKALADAHEALKKQAAESRAALADPARRAQVQEARERDQADVKYCWK